MSSLIFQLTPESVLIATDTLAVDMDTRTPYFFSTKAYPLPHLKGIMCCTGLSDVGVSWFPAIARALARDVHELDEYVTEQLVALGDAFPAIQEQSVTIYHFGYSIAEGRFVGFAYRSKNAFKSERVSYSLGVKPPTATMKFEVYPDDLISMMEAQRREQKALPKESRLFIGGEIQCFWLSKEGMTTNTIHRFDDYEEDYRQMCEAAGLRGLGAA